MKCYAVAKLDVTDRSWVRDYVQNVTRMVEASGGRYLARTPSAERLEGDGPLPQLFLLIEWPSKGHAKIFYESAEYAPYRQRRLAGSTGEFVLVAGEDINQLAHVT